MNEKLQENNKDWKNKNEKYLNSLQRFLDIADNIKEQNLKQSVIGAMLMCDKVLTDLADAEISKLEIINKNAK